jgi:FAD/FMN-containing dehydrogenase
MDGKFALAGIVGAADVVEDPEIGVRFSLHLSDVPFMRPRFLVRPANAEEVQGIVSWANRTRTPLIPLSSGEPHYLGTVPTAPGAVVVDLRRMNRILKIDRRSRLALIEPGVTYTRLQPELGKHGLRINTPLMPRKNKSVLASLLEREPLISPCYQWNMAEPLRSLEIVWGNGDRLFSGSGFFQGKKASDWKRGLVPVSGPGPGQQLDFYKFVSAAQGSMGIVTWASVKCEVVAEERKLFIVPAGNPGDLIDFTYELLKLRFGDELFLMNGTALAFLLAREAKKTNGLKALLPPWALIVGISGGQILAREKVRAREADVREMAEKHGLEMVSAVPGCKGQRMQELLLGPSAEPYWKLRPKGHSEELFFLTTLGRTPGFIATMHALAEKHRFPASDIGVYLQPAHQGVCCHCEFLLPFDPGSAGETRKARELFEEASLYFFVQGAFFSRPYGRWADMVYNADAMNMVATQKVKKVFDPNNVMNPGKLCF